MDVKSYQNQAEGFVKRYLLADPCLPYTSVLSGIFLCKMVIIVLVHMELQTLVSRCFKHCSLCSLGLWSYGFIQLSSHQIILSSHKNEENWMEQQVREYPYTRYALCLNLIICLFFVYYYLDRGISTVHAVFISFMALYFVFFSDLFSDQTSLQGLMVFRSSPLSNFGLGVSSHLVHFSISLHKTYPDEHLVCLS